MRRQISAAVAGMAGEASSATIRSASSALAEDRRPPRDPGSIFQGSVASSSALAAPISRHVASSASWGAQRAQAADAASSTPAATAARSLTGRRRGPTPPHFECTTVATRATRLPRLLARSEL